MRAFVLQLMTPVLATAFALSLPAQAADQTSAKLAEQVTRSTNSTILEVHEDTGLVLVSNPTATSYDPGQIVCLDLSSGPAVCAYVVATMPNGVLLWPSKQSLRRLSAGLTVSLAIHKRSKALGQGELAIVGNRRPHAVSRSIVSVGANFARPILRFEQTVNEAVAVGALASMLAAPATQVGSEGYTGLLTASVYPTRSKLPNWSVGIGLGAYVLKSAQEISTAGLTAVGETRYSWISRQGYVFTLGCAAQALFSTNLGTTLVPWATAEIGLVL